MCDRYSWIVKDKKVIFLTGEDVFNTKRGRALQKYTQCKCDLHGHGAIRWFYNFTGGEEKECTDFYSTDNFPKDIVKAIKSGKMWAFGITPSMNYMLTKPALAEYEKTKQQALAEYKKIKQQAWAKYEKIEQQALAKCEKTKQQALAEYKKIRQHALARYEKIRQQAWAEYEKIEQQALAKCEKIRQQAWAEYEKIRQQAWAKYEKIRQQAWASIFACTKNRIREWR